MIQVTKYSSLSDQIASLEALAAHFFAQAEREKRAHFAEASVRSAAKALEALDQAAALRTSLKERRDKQRASRQRYISNLRQARNLAHWALQARGAAS